MAQGRAATSPAGTTSEVLGGVMSAEDLMGHEENGEVATIASNIARISGTNDKGKHQYHQQQQQPYQRGQCQDQHERVSDCAWYLHSQASLRSDVQEHSG